MSMRAMIAVLLAMTVATGAFAEVEQTASGLRATCSGLALEIASPGARGATCALRGQTVSAPVIIEITDGRTGETLPVPDLMPVMVNANMGSCSWTAEGLEGTIELSSGPDSVLWHLSIENTGDQQRWLEVTVALPAPLKAPWAAWDGLNETAAVNQPIVRQGIGSAFPMVCAYDGERGVALALQPQVLLSDMTVGSDPGRTTHAVYLSAKMVVDPGDTEAIDLVAFAFTPDFGWRNALATYYRLYSACFAPTEGISDHIYLTGGYTRAGASRLAWEECRRFGFGWDWGYAPYRFTGDWYAHEEYWDGEYGDLAEYHAQMRERYATTNRTAAGLSYVNLQFIEINLAQEHFPDALRTDARGEVLTRTGDHIKRDEQVTGAFYGGNSIAEHSLRCLTELAEERGVAGIAFDNAMGTGMRHGPGPANSPGRSYQRGPDAVWCAEGIPAALHMDHTHTLSNGQHKLMVFANGPACYLTCFRTDGAMHEAEPYYGIKRVDAMRVMLGRKPIVCWEDHPERHLKWERMSPEDLREAIRASYDYWVMTCLHKALLPSAHRLRGNRVLQRHLPQMLAVVRAGWQPVPAIRCAQDLWLARFGEGTETILTAGNATGQNLNASLEVINAYLGKGPYAFAPMDGGLLESHILDGRTLVSLPIAHRTTAVLRAALALEGLSEAVVTCEGLPEDPDAPVTIRWRLHVPGGASDLTMRHWVPEGATVSAVRVAGQTVRFGQTGAALTMTADLPARAATLEIDITPHVMVLDREALLGFPFLANDRPACQIVHADDADEDTLFAAERIAAFFEYWTAAQVKPGATASTLANVEGRALIPVFPAASADPETPMVVVGRYGAGLCAPSGAADGAGRVRVRAGQPPVLEVSGRDAAAINDAAVALLNLLDEKYQYRGVMVSRHPLFERAGLVGKLFE